MVLKQTNIECKPVKELTAGRKYIFLTKVTNFSQIQHIHGVESCGFRDPKKR